MHDYIFFLPAASAVLCAGIAALAITRNPGHPANTGFALGMAALAFIEAGHAVILFKPWNSSGVLLSYAGESLLPPAWLLFSIAFGRKGPKLALSRWKPVFYAFAAVSAVFLMLGVTGRLSMVPEEPAYAFSGARALLILKTPGIYFYIYILSGSVLSLFHLEAALRSSAGPTRSDIRQIVFGVGAILAFMVYYSSQALLFRHIDANTLPLLSAVTLASAALMGRYLITHRILEFNIFVSRHIVYKSVTVLAASVYLLSVGAVTKLISHFDISFNYFITTLFVFASVILFLGVLSSEAVRKKAERFIIRHFYRHKYEFRWKWLEATERISTNTDALAVKEILTGMVSETMGVKPVHIWLYDPVLKVFLSSSPGIDERFRQIGPAHPLITHMRSAREPFMLLEEDKSSAAHEIEELAARTATVLCTPLLANNELIGFMLQGEDTGKEPYGGDDFDLLKAITAQAAVQIKNIRLNEDLVAAKEAEVFHRMSSFIMHDLKNFTNSLSLVSQNARRNISKPEFQKEAIKAIDQTVSRMKALIEKMDDSPSGLVLRREDAELKSILERAVKRMGMSKAASIHLECRGHALTVKGDPEAIETVFVNILSNACDATGLAGEIKAVLSREGGFACIRVEDTGTGIPKRFMEAGLFRPFKTTKSNGFGIGLYQSKTVVEAHGGTIEVESEEGKGTAFTLKFPLPAETSQGYMAAQA